MLARRISVKFLLVVWLTVWLFVYFKLTTRPSKSFRVECPEHTYHATTGHVNSPNRHGRLSYGSKKKIGRQNDASASYGQDDKGSERNPRKDKASNIYGAVVGNDLPGSYTRVAKSTHIITDTNHTPIINFLPQWQRNLLRCQGVVCRADSNTPDHAKKYFVTVVVKCRIYETDKARWTVRELKQWLHYLFLAGVEHVFFCDHFQNDSERLHIALQRYTEAGLVTYIPWSYKNSNDMEVQVVCYQHVINHYRSLSTWQIAIDMDEYPFSVIDTREGFVRRFLENITKSRGSDVTEISMENYLLLGQGNRSRDLVIDRINRMTPRPANNLVKPIYRPERISKVGLHHNYILSGRKIVADSDMLRMAHYWGARTQNWGPDTPETINKTVEMNLVRNSWAEKLRNSLLSWGETDAFATDSGP